MDHTTTLTLILIGTLILIFASLCTCYRLYAYYARDLRDGGRHAIERSKRRDREERERRDGGRDLREGLEREGGGGGANGGGNGRGANVITITP